jgi:endonuclease YncB( thermonuclease family)
MSTILSLVFSKVGLYAAIVLAIFVAGFALCWHLEHRTPETFSDTLSVASVANGATIQARAGLLGRASRPVFLAGVSAPGLNDPLGPESRDNLASLAGDTIRIESETRPIGAKPLVGQCFGDTGADLAIAQLRAGLAICESGATKEQIAAQKQAQTAKRGLWASSGGSHWWHFSVAQVGDFPEPRPLIPEEHSMFDFGLILEIAVLVIVALWIFWYFAGPAIAAKFSAATAVTTAVDTSEQLASYGALTVIRYTPCVAADPQAVTACEYLRTVCTAWTTPAVPAAAKSTAAA